MSGKEKVRANDDDGGSAINSTSVHADGRNANVMSVNRNRPGFKQRSKSAKPKLSAEERPRDESRDAQAVGAAAAVLRRKVQAMARAMRPEQKALAQMAVTEPEMAPQQTAMVKDPETTPQLAELARAVRREQKALAQMVVTEPRRAMATVTAKDPEMAP